MWHVKMSRGWGSFVNVILKSHHKIFSVVEKVTLKCSVVQVTIKCSVLYKSLQNV